MQIHKAILVLLLLFLMPVANANIEYTQNAREKDGTYDLGQGIFNSAITTDAAQLKTLGDLKEVPLIADLDGDSTQEIIVADGDEIKIYEGISLSVVDSFDFGADEAISNIIIRDIDGDAPQEIIFIMEVSELVQILEYNGSVFTNQSTMDLGGSITHVDGQFTLQCGEIDECLAVYHNRLDNTEGPDLYAVPFSSTAIGTEITLYSAAPTGENFCFPQIRSMPYADTDNGGDSEYIVNAMRFISSGDDQIHFYEIEVSGGVATEINEEIFDNCELGHGAFDSFTSGAPECDIDNLPRFFSAPIVGDFDNAAGNGLEIIFAANVDPDEFVLCRLDSDFDRKQDHPETFESDGRILSNPFSADIFSDNTDTQDYCILGHDSISEELQVTCGSAIGTVGLGVETIQFKYDTTGLQNVSTNFNTHEIITHSLETSNTQFDTASGSNTINTNEILTPYGVMQISVDTFDFESFHLYQLYDLGIDNVACIGANAQESGLTPAVGPIDLVCATQTALYYIDDGISDSPATLGPQTFNPCLPDDPIQVNETITLTFAVNDGNNPTFGLSNVSANVTMYAGTSSAYELSFSEVGSGTTLPFSLVANVTGAGTLIIEGWDGDNPEIIDTETYFFTVGLTGVQAGESQCIKGEEVTTEEETGDSDSIGGLTSTTAVGGGVNALSEDLNSTPFTIWIVVMIMAAFAGIAAIAASPIAGSVGLVIVETGLLIIGVKEGIISPTIVLIICAIVIIPIGVWVGSLITGNRSRA